MAEPVLLYEVRDEIAFITMNRPEQRNAMNGELCDAIRDVWPRFQADAAAKVAILLGAGRDFSVGKDMRPGAGDPDVPFQLHQAYPRNGIDIFKPLIAAVHGYVIGGAYALAIRGCDITIAADNTLIGFPEGRAGIAIPPIDYLPYLPFKVSLEFMLLAWKGAQMMDAQRAYQLGFVNKVVPHAELLDEAVRWAEQLKSVPPLYIKSVKHGHYRDVISRIRRYELEYLDYVWPQLQSQDREEAIKAFAEKREPRFEGR
jgi:enoyl-CoA hydratase/carnithine racemase